MKKIVCVIVSFIASALAFAQSDITWEVSHDNQKLFSSSIENEEQNNLAVKLSNLKSGKNFIIIYQGIKANDKKNEWKRTIGIYSNADKELYRKDSDMVKIPDMLLTKMLMENKNIKVYTWALPKDPKEAARVRVRRVHLCTIMLKQ